MSPDTKNPADQNAKKPYTIPRLLVYGDVKELTRAAGNKAATSDGPPHGSNDKTA